MVPTDFTSLIHTWETVYGGQGYLYNAEPPVLGVGDDPRELAMLELAPGAPNPVRTGVLLRYSLGREAHIRLAIFDIAGRKVAVLADGPRAAGDYAVQWDASQVPSGAYLCRLEELRADGDAVGSRQTRKLLVIQ